MARRRIGALVAIVVVALLVAGIRHLLATPVVPAIVTRNADAHRELSPSLGAHIDRFLHERIPGDRANRPRLVALTFDDGPYPVETPLLLDALHDLHVPATFFLIGDDTELFPQLAQRIEAAGDEIANHTQTHPARFDALDARHVDAELAAGAATLQRYVHDPAIRTMMRPPHGRFTERTVETAQRAGYDVILWSDDPGDWRAAATPAVIDAHVGRYATAPDIILMHSGRMNTIAALPAVVARFRAAGFTFVTVGDLMHRVPMSEIVHPQRLRV